MTTQRSKISLEEAMNISLDDYIDMTNMYCNTRNKQTNNSIIIDTEGLFNSSATSNNNQHDIPSVLDMPKPSSQQWRLRSPNLPSRPAGMPPLVPVESEKIHINNNNNNNDNNNKKNNNNNNRRWKNNKRKRNNQKNKNRNRNNIRYFNRNNVTGNGENLTNYYNRSNRFTARLHNNGYQINYNNNSPVRNNMNNYNNGNNFINNSIHGHNNMTRNMIDNNDTHKFINNEYINNNNIPPLTIQNDTSLIPFGNKNDVIEHVNNVGKDLLTAVSLNILERLKGFQNKEEKKYDMKIQKEISMIQGKCLFYKCPGGNVISCDGPGIECNLTPVSTDVSMNQRFA